MADPRENAREGVIRAGNPARWVTTIHQDVGSGFMDVAIPASTILALAPPHLQREQEGPQRARYIQQVMEQIEETVRHLRPGDTLVHLDTIQVRYLPNERNPRVRSYERPVKLLPVTGEDMLAFCNMPPYVPGHGQGSDNRAALAAWYERVTGRLAEPLPVDVSVRGVYADTTRGLFCWAFEHPAWPLVPEGGEARLLAIRNPLPTPAPLVAVGGRNLLRVAYSENIGFLWAARFGPDEPEEADADQGAYLRAWEIGSPVLLPDRRRLPDDAVCIGVNFAFSQQVAEGIYFHPSFAEVPFGAEIPRVSFGVSYPQQAITTAAEWNRARRRW